MRSQLTPTPTPMSSPASTAPNNKRPAPSSPLPPPPPKQRRIEDLLTKQPNDHLNCIFVYFDGRDLFRMRRVCKRLAFFAHKHAAAASAKHDAEFARAAAALEADLDNHENRTRLVAALVPGVTTVRFGASWDRFMHRWMSTGIATLCAHDRFLDIATKRCGWGIRVLDVGAFRDTGSIDDEGAVLVAQRCPRLEELNLFGSIITDAAIDRITAACPLLTKLSIHDCGKLTHRALRYIAARCPRLTNLDADFYGATAFAISLVAKRCTNLTELHVRDVDEKAAEAIATHCTRLVDLDLSHASRDATDRAIEAIAARCAQLTSFRVAFSKKITDASIVTLATRCSRLETLSVSSCFFLTDRSIEAIVTHCTALRTLCISGCCRLSARSLALLATHRPELAQLNVGFCDWINDGAIEALVAGCRRLTWLDLGYNNRLTDRAIEAVAARCEGLTGLDAHGLALTPRSLDALRTMPALRYAEVGTGWVTRITREDLAAFRRDRPWVVIY